MAIIVNDNIQNNSPKSLDAKYTKFVGGLSTPYSSVEEANTIIIPQYRSIGLTVLINIDGVNTEYWYKDGINNIDLVVKDQSLAIGAENVGTGVGLFKSRVGDNLQFKTILTSGPLTITEDVNEITFTLPVATSSTNGYLSSADWTTFNNKVPTTRSIFTTNSLTGGGSLASNRTLQLVNDQASPGNGYYYGTDNSGVKGWYLLPVSSGSGLTSLNGLTSEVQTFATGSTGTDFAISSVGSTHTFNIPSASATNRGLLTSSDWSIFNAKVDPARSILTTNSLTGGGNLSANRTLQLVNDQASPGNSFYYGTNPSGVKGWYALPTPPATGIQSINSLTDSTQTLVVGSSGSDFNISSASGVHTFNLPTASSLNRGLLSSADWVTFNNKVATTRAVNTTNSLTGGGNLSADRTLQLVNDSAAPGNSKYYGTSATGTKGWHDLPVSTGEVNTGSNLGALGARVFESKVGVDLRFRRLVAGANMTITENANDIVFAASASGGTTLADGNYGDITVANTGSTMTLNIQSVTLAKIQNIATNTVLGRYSAGTGSVQQATLGTGLSYVSSALTVSLAPFSTSNLSEGTNLYYTDARARAAISATAPILYNNTTGVISITQSNSTTDGFLSSTDWNTFNNKVPTTRAINTTGSLSGGGNLTTNRTLQLVNDSTSPGNFKYYGTNGSGTKGFYDLPTPPTVGIVSLNGLSDSAQTLAVGSAGTDFNITSSSGVHTFNLPTASATNRGLLSSADWTTFNNKVDPTRTISTTNSITGGGNLSVDRTLRLVNDVATPGANKLYGTDGSGVRGWFDRATGTVSDLTIGDLTPLFNATVINSTTVPAITFTAISQSANLVYASPSSGSGLPSFRALVSNDIPNLSAGKIINGVFPIARGGTGLSTLGTANQLIRVNSAGTALEYFTPTYLTSNQIINFTASGDVTGTSSGATSLTPALTITNNAVTNAKLADMATSTIKGRVASGTGDPQDLTGAQVNTLLPVFTSSLKGLTPASGGGVTNFLRADGTWAPPPSGSVTSVGLSMPSAFTVSGSPITSSGTLTVTGAGTTSQYIRGDGSLATFPDVGEINTGANLGSGAGIYANKSGVSLRFKSLLGAGPITLSSTSNDIIIDIPAANSSTNGYLSSSDWSIFNSKVSTSRAVNTINSITGGGDLSSNRTLQLVNDQSNPLPLSYYGTNASGVKGFHLLPGGSNTIYYQEGTYTAYASSTVPNFLGTVSLNTGTLNEVTLALLAYDTYSQHSYCKVVRGLFRKDEANNVTQIGSTQVVHSAISQGTTATIDVSILVNIINPIHVGVSITVGTVVPPGVKQFKWFAEVKPMPIGLSS